MERIFLIVAILIPQMSAHADFESARNSKCKLFLRASDAGLKVSWHGRCQEGFAEGLGAVRYLNKNTVTSVFYGNLKRGYWDFGVFDTGRGYVAGSFEKNQRIQVEAADGEAQRNRIIKAFDTASKAALQLSEEFKNAGNEGSAKHYKAEAEKLSQQMD